jgi:hypothetical protein
MTCDRVLPGHDRLVVVVAPHEDGGPLRDRRGQEALRGLRGQVVELPVAPELLLVG